jgi:hypothetical protein
MIYSDSALTQPVPNPLIPCTISGQIGCLDGLGNATFYMTPGAYTYTITGSGLNAYGPIPRSTSCIPGLTCVAYNVPGTFTSLITFGAGITGTGNTGTLGLGSTALGAANAWTGNQTHAGLESFSGGFLSNTTLTNSAYAAEFANAGSFTRGQIRIGQPNTETGITVSSTNSGNAVFALGAVADTACASGFRALSSSWTDMHFGSLLYELHALSGLTPGTCITPTQALNSLRAVISGSQIAIYPGTAGLPAYAFGNESPNPGTGIHYASDPAIVFSICGASPASNCSDGVHGGLGVDQLKIITNELQPFTDNILAIGDTTHRLTNVFATTIDCGTAGNITCIQSDGSNNVFVCNSNCAALNFTPGTNVVLNKGISATAGTGYQAAGATGCATGAAAGSTCTTVISWGSSFTNTSYRPHCDGIGITSGVPVEGGITATANGSVTFQTVAATAAVAQFTNIVCSAFHD